MGNKIADKIIETSKLFYNNRRFRIIIIGLCIISDIVLSIYIFKDANTYLANIMINFMVRFIGAAIATELLVLTIKKIVLNKIEYKKKYDKKQ